VTRRDYVIALGMAAGVAAVAWLAGGLGAPDPVPTSALAVHVPAEPVGDAATADPVGVPEWLVEAEADWVAGDDTPRLARIHEAVEVVAQAGGRWEPVTPDLGDALAEGVTPDGWATTSDYPWESCAVAYGETTVVVCPDGWVVTS
jgi:hypothetical protein